MAIGYVTRIDLVVVTGTIDLCTYIHTYIHTYNTAWVYYVLVTNPYTYEYIQSQITAVGLVTYRRVTVMLRKEFCHFCQKGCK